MWWVTYIRDLLQQVSLSFLLAINSSSLLTFYYLRSIFFSVLTHWRFGEEEIEELGMDGMSMTPNSGDRPRTIWTASMNHYFMDLVLDQVRRGNMIDHAFRKQVWAHMTTLFNEKFGFQYDKDVLKNRYKSLRRKYNEITTLLKQTGFHWDGTRQMVIADDSVWDNYIKAHPDARSYRTKILPNYSDLCMIYGSAPPDGKYSHLGHQEVLEESSSRTKSGGEISGEGPVAQRDDVDDDAMDSSDSGQDMTQRRTDEEITNGICEVENTDHSLATTSKEAENNLFPVEVVFALEASPPILNNADGYRSRVSWTPPMDRYFIDLMLDHVRQGNKIGRTFSKDAWMHMIALFSERFGSQYDKDVLYNRFKTLRKQYVIIRTLLDHDGFDWDEALQMVRADVQVWDEYIKAHPEARQYRVRPLPHFNDLCIIYGGSTVLGKISYSDHVNLKDDIHGFKTGGMSRTPAMHRDQTNDVQEESSYLSGDMDTPNPFNKRLFVTPLVSEHSKKPRWTTDESMVDALREMANAVALLAEKKKENDDSVSIENVIDALQALPDLDEDLFLDACDLLEDEKKAKTFLVLDVRLRKKWLMRKLRPS